MARFQPKTFTDYLTRMAQRVVARTELTDLEIGGVVHTILVAAAREMDEISWQMANLQALWDLDTATGDDLDARAQDLNPEKLTRTLATKASNVVEFTRSTTAGTITIPVGTAVRVPNGPEYVTTAVGLIGAGATTSPLIPVLAVEPGTAGNVDPNTITQLDAVTGVEGVTNPVATTTPGQDRETDAQFRARIKGYLRSLSRGTPDALKFAVLDTFLEDFGRVVSAEVFELPEPNLGQTIIYVDNGAGTIAIPNSTMAELVVGTAVGGEDILFLDNVPVIPGTPAVIRKNGVALVQGVDFTFNEPRGQISLAVPLVGGDTIDADYSWYGGLIQEAQRIVDGARNMRLVYPGYRAAGTKVSVLPPTVLQQTIEASLTIEDGFVGQTLEVQAAVRAALNRYVNGLGINGDVILSELVYHAQSVPGVLDVVFTNPTSNIIIGSGQLARVVDGNIDFT